MSMEIDFSELISGIADLQVKADAAVQAYAQKKADTLQTYAKKNAPWTDRTGAARRSLNSYVTRPKNGVTRINLAHGVSYGIKLEFGLGMRRRYAIIEPTINKKSRQIMDGMAGLIDRLDINYQSKVGSMISKYTGGKGWT